jgi:cell division protein ZapA
MGTLHINVLGTDFSIAAKEDDHYLITLLENYKAMVRIIEKTNAESGTFVQARHTPSDSLKTAILAGIMLCDELYKEKQKSARLSENGEQDSSALDEVGSIILQMIDKIDKALL